MSFGVQGVGYLVFFGGVGAILMIGSGGFSGYALPNKNDPWSKLLKSEIFRVTGFGFGLRGLYNGSYRGILWGYSGGS